MVRDGLARLRRQAENNPSSDVARQRYMDALARHAPQQLVDLVNAGSVARTPATLAAYTNALARLGRLDAAKFEEINALHRAASPAPPTGPSSAFASPSSASLLQSSSMGGAGAGQGFMAGAVPAAGGMAALGTRQAPLFVQSEAPSRASQAAKLSLQVLAWLFLGSLVTGMIMDAPSSGSSGGSLSKAMSAGKEEVVPWDGETVTFADVQGVDEAKDDLQEVVAFLKSPDKFSTLGGKLPKGVLLVGSPGTGKTLLARAVAGEAGVPFYYASGSEFDEMYVGVGARRVRNLFEAAKANAPCIVFIDEIDAVGSKRIDRDSRLYHMTLNQLLTEMDGFETTAGVVVIAATNTPERLDAALVRPGRFDRMVVVPLPDVSGRVDILGVHLRDVPVDDSVDVSRLARGTPGMSGAELANVVNTAALRAARDGRPAVSMNDLELAKEKIIMGEPAKSFGYTDDVKRTVAYHEGGHALVALFTPAAVPLHKVSIIPRRSIGALGVTSQLPENDDPNWSLQQLEATLDVCMGGRVSEELVLGEHAVTLGASSDLQKATDVAYKMDTALGSSPRLRSLIEDEVARLLAESYARAKSLLLSHRHELDLLADALLEKETLDADEVRTIIGRS
ncbi:intermembrane space AAA protease IAP-1 [Thecamonas trahens ATCC 50062]|uniref:Intermembrane space AAA protease IAP-1 n=1 Tax=Thecamonas trahens ATCC 50062 TaxID=461836 RepID=A0A0L0D8X5_THETB|nr:intermembrane space AAA protease IAP-1 [Thecamonas trahens ATCC 50062]KNC48526.1 intermembrane space AAA protease IAP-1 [Thecamonas trahens ATCC 50062]|eukprot:XP_013758634.1 intermembrane space AAA protease IAP-1 [Thecamonas trahens ATCC 50062]